MTDKKAMKAAADLYRLAQAYAMFREYRESEGHEPPSVDALVAWRHRHPLSPGEKIRPTDEDYEAVKREHPELVRVADRSKSFSWRAPEN
jgi:hypothetical protein